MEKVREANGALETMRTPCMEEFGTNNMK